MQHLYGPHRPFAVPVYAVGVVAYTIYENRRLRYGYEGLLYDFYEDRVDGLLDKTNVVEWQVMEIGDC